MDIKRVCCFTGHRVIPSTDLPKLTRLLGKTIETLVGEGVVYWGAGGAVGFDTLAAYAVIKQREKNPAVKLIMVLPCRGQDVRWRERDRQKFRLLLEAADKVVCLSEHYYDGCMVVRNRHLVEHSGVCVAYMTRAQSGAGQTVNLARERGLRVINLAEREQWVQRHAAGTPGATRTHYPELAQTLAAIIQGQK